MSLCTATVPAGRVSFPYRDAEELCEFLHRLLSTPTTLTEPGVEWQCSPDAERMP